MNELIFTVYFLMSVLLFIASAPSWDLFHSQFSLKFIFIYQYLVYKHTKDDFNILGIIIMEAIVTALTFGASMLIMLMLAIIFVIMQLWYLFRFLFKKR